MRRQSEGTTEERNRRLRRLLLFCEPHGGLLDRSGVLVIDAGHWIMPMSI